MKSKNLFFHLFHAEFTVSFTAFELTPIQTRFFQKQQHFYFCFIFCNIKTLILLFKILNSLQCIKLVNLAVINFSETFFRLCWFSLFVMVSINISKICCKLLSLTLDCFVLTFFKHWSKNYILPSSYMFSFDFI